MKRKRLKKGFIKRVIYFVLTTTVIMSNMQLDIMKVGQDVYATDLAFKLTYNVLSNNTIEITGCGENDTYIVIPEEIDGKEVKSIGSYAFEGLKNLKSVELSEGLEKIEYRAFYDCDGLTEIKIPESVVTISEDAFMNCDGITEVVIPDGVKGKFNDCFFGCKNLERIKIGKGITIIGDYSFEGLENLKSVELSEGLEKIEYRAFYDCDGLTEIKIPESVVTISEDAFMNCDGITEVVIPDGVKGKFNDCFFGCKNLERIKIGKGITIIGDYSFEGLKNLKSVELSEGLEKIEYRAFYDCDGLTEIKIPESVVTISEDAFMNCDGITEVVIPDGVKGKFNDCFFGCKNLERIKIGKGITIIGDYSFEGLENLKSVELSEGLEKIEYLAFYDCDGLTEIKIPESVVTISEDAFANCDRLDKIYFFGSAPTVGSSFIPNKDTICAYYNPYDGDWSDVISKADKVNWIEFDGENITEVKLFSINPIGNLKVGESVELLASTYVNGDFADEQGNLSFVIADTSIVDYDGFRKTEDGTMITLHAKSKGTTVLTVTDNDTGKKTYKSISVDDYGINLLADNMPVFNDNGAKYNAYVSGMYVSNFTKSKIGESYYRIEMDIYNSKQCYGSVDVYDSNHQLKYSKKIDKHSGGNLTSIKDTILAAGNLVSDVLNLNILSFKNRAYATPTHIDITVPVGGYIEIGNNIDKLPSSSIYNNCDLLSFALMKYLSLYKNNTKSENVRSSITAELVDRIINSSIKDKFVQKMQLATLEELTVSNIYDYMKMLTGSSYTTLTALDIDVEKIFFDCLGDTTISTAEDIFMDLSGFAGEALGACFNGGEYANVATQMVQMIGSRDSEVIRVDTYTSDNQLIDNGIKVDNGNNYEYVLRTFEIIDGENYDKTKEILGNSQSEFKLFDIYMLKNDIVTQPSGNVKVSIPIPEGYSTSGTKVYRIEDDGTKTDMKAYLEGGYLVFTTNHFSLYAIVENDIVMGDVNNDGEINIKDSALIKRYLSGADVEINLEAADVNGDGQVNIKDSALIKRKLAGWE